ncbi:MAG: class E sortase [Lachnospiraceae bacterium]|nr:class E sortase [Lachnospiraceae bacterium]
MKKKGLFAGMLILVILLMAIGYLYYQQGLHTKKTIPSVSAQPDTEISIAPTLATPGPTLDLYSRNSKLPYDKLFITKERQKYKSGDLTLHIPKLDIDLAVQNGTDKAQLALGPGLYDYAQLPGEGDRNVSIAAHRNKSRNGVISPWFFYYIDTLTTHDYIYLSDKKHIYRYVYEDTTVVEETDWGPIYSQGFSCITLTSCEPIGVADHRIIVRGKLDAIFPFKKSFSYIEKEESGK